MTFLGGSEEVYRELLGIFLGRFRESLWGTFRAFPEDVPRKSIGNAYEFFWGSWRKSTWNS